MGIFPHKDVSKTPQVLNRLYRPILAARSIHTDVVWFSAGEKHWHGASPTTGMTHIAIQEKKDGKVVDWMEHVSNEQYRKQ